MLLMSLSSGAAVTQTKYQLVYNTTTCRYDVYLVVLAGSATAGNERKTYTAQVSLVVPVGTSIGAITGNYPRQSFNGGNTLGSPLAWGIQNYQLGSAAYGLNGFEVYSLTVPTSQSFYPALSSSTNSPLLLFSIELGSTSCGSGIRLWENNYIQAGPGAPLSPAAADPTSAQFNNKDFNNGHDFYDATASAPAQTYSGNVAGSTTMDPPVISAFAVTSTSTTVSGTVTASSGACASALGNTYAWTGPGAYSTSGTTVAGVVNTFTRPAFVAGIYTVTVTNTNGCTATRSASVGVALPIKLTYFKGAAQKCAAQLNWQVGAGEKDFQRFEVQYSADGSRFATVGQVDRNAYNDNYSFSYTQASGKGYYRLKILDLSGKVSYSPTIDVTTDCDGPAITIAPNPTTGIATVSGIEAGDQVKVTDMLGNVIANYISGGARATIDLEIFPAGTYSVIISRDTEVIKAEKITKM